MIAGSIYGSIYCIIRFNYKALVIIYVSYPMRLSPRKIKAEYSQPIKYGSSICRGKHIPLTP